VSAKDRFEAEAKKEGFAVQFSREVARVVRYEDPKGAMEFTVDLGSKGNHSIAIDPVSVKSAREKLALERTKRFLQACGFEVELS
jgi:hypothetical protein